MKIDEFIRKTFLEEYQCIVYNHPYIGCILIVHGIELLGRCLDNDHDFDHHSSNCVQENFKRAMKEFPTEYKAITTKQWGVHIRNGFAHSMIMKPTSPIVLTRRQPTSHKHLDLYQGKRLIIVEDFYEHFCKACENVTIKMKLMTHEKFNREFLNVRDDQNSGLCKISG
jgi:hypothetical protein